MAKKNKKQTSRQDEYAELEKTYKKTAGKYAKKAVKKSNNGLVIAICILIPVLFDRCSGLLLLHPGSG